MKRLFRLCIAVFVMLTFVFGLACVSYADGSGNGFTVTITPQEGSTNVLTEVEDCEIGSTVKFDVFVANDTEESVKLADYWLELDLSEGLTYVSVQKYARGTLTEGTHLGKPTFAYYSGSMGLINIDAGSSVRILTLTLTVADSGLTYGQVLTAEMTEDSNLYFTESIYDDAVYPEEVSGSVEIVTAYNVIWTGLVGEDETGKVGVGLTPEHDNPVKSGYTFTGWSPVPAPITKDETYTAQWTPTQYDVTFPAGISFGEGVPVPTAYDIENPITAIPVKAGCTFTGWTAAPAVEGDTDYNWPEGVITDTSGYYGNVVLTPRWTVNADVAFADYAYAGYGEAPGGGIVANKLMLVGLQDIDEGNAVFYDGNLLFTTEDENYLALLNADGGTYTRAYLYIVAGGTSAQEAKAALSVDPGVNEAILRDGDVNRSGVTNSGDYGVIDSMLFGRSETLSVRSRLEADVFTEPYDGYLFGSIKDIVRIIAIING